VTTADWLNFGLIKTNYGNFGEDVKDESQDGKVDADALATEALPQVFRHGVHTAGHVDGYEDPTQQDQDEHSLDISTVKCEIAVKCSKTIH
jgi:hypothetical protein